MRNAHTQCGRCGRSGANSTPSTPGRLVGSLRHKQIKVGKITSAHALSLFSIGKKERKNKASNNDRDILDNVGLEEVDFRGSPKQHCSTASGVPGPLLQVPNHAILPYVHIYATSCVSSVVGPPLPPPGLPASWIFFVSVTWLMVTKRWRTQFYRSSSTIQTHTQSLLLYIYIRYKNSVLPITWNGFLFRDIFSYKLDFTRQQ